jgi:N6-adenosine-specific RNA methylase IME4
VTAAYAPTGPAAPIVGVATGVVVAWKTKEYLDQVKDSLVCWGYSLVN